MPLSFTVRRPPHVPHTFTVHYTEALVRASAKRRFLRLLKSEVTWALYLVVSVLICLPAYDLSCGRVSWVDGAMGTIVFLAPTIALYGYRAHLAEALARLRQMKDPTATFAATTEPLVVSSDMGSSTVPWDRFKEIIEADSFWVLVSPSGMVETPRLQAKERFV